MSLITGQVLIARYHINEIIGRGGFGAVYRAHDTRLNMTVAVKENLEVSAKSQQQFEQEGHMLARLSHPNLPRVIDHFIISSQGQYLVMDFVEGHDLRSLLKQHGTLPISQVLTWMEQICDALHYLHTQNPPVIHRDIKPSNIKIRPDGRAILVDFGIAKLYVPDSKTMLGARGITRGFSPPEQYGGSRTDARSDIYALGTTLFSLLTSQVPPDSLQRSVNNIPLPSPRQINPEIPLDLEQLILTATEISIEKRFQTIADFRSGLIAVQQNHSALSPHVSQSATSDKQPLPFGFPIVIGSVVTVGLILGLIALVVMMNQGRGADEPTMVIAAIEPSPTPMPMETFTPMPTSTTTPTPFPTPTATPMPSTIYLEYLVDVSNSMLEPLVDRKSKLEAVQAALAEHWEGLMPPPNIGLRVYGHRFDALNQTQSCLDTELLAPPRQGQTAALVEVMGQVSPRGRSPLAVAIREATSDFSFSGSDERTNALIVIADSGDSCDTDPCQMLEFQRDAGLRYPVYVIGLAVDEASEREALRCLAATSGGLYHDAATTSELLQRLDEFGRLIVR